MLVSRQILTKNDRRQDVLKLAHFVFTQRPDLASPTHVTSALLPTEFELGRNFRGGWENYYSGVQA